jgi:hypothetical protein
MLNNFEVDASFKQTIIQIRVRSTGMTYAEASMYESAYLYSSITQAARRSFYKKKQAKRRLDDQEDQYVLYAFVCCCRLKGKCIGPKRQTYMTINPFKTIRQEGYRYLSLKLSLTVERRCFCDLLVTTDFKKFTTKDTIL